MKRIKPLFAVLFVTTLAVFLPALRIHAETDKTNLQAAYDRIQSALQNESDYHAASFDAFETDYALLGGDAAVTALIADPLAPQEAVDEKTEKLETILSHLTLHQTYVRINALYWTTQAEDRSAYTARSRAVYDAELARLEAILANPRSGEEAVLAIETDLLDAFELLELLADRAALLLRDAEIQAILDNDASLYTPNSFALFETAVADLSVNLLGTTGKTARAIIDDPDASVAEALLAMTALDEAEARLVLRVDMTALLAGLETAEESNLSGFTPASRQVFLNELASIRAVAENPNATQAEADQAILDLLDSFSLLVELADKTVLTEHHAAVLVAFYELRHEYTPLSHEAFRQAVMAYGHYFAVEAMLDDADALQEDVDALASTLAAALTLLVRRADIAAPSALLETLLALDLSGYTPASIAVFEALLDQAQTILNDPNTDQISADDLASELRTAQSLLVAIADKTALVDALALAQGVVRSRYSTSSLQTLDLWIENANAVLADADATQSEVDSMKDRIDQIRASLLRKSQMPSIRANSDTLDLNDYVFVYEATVLAYDSSDPSVLAITPEGIAEGLRFGVSTVTITLSNGVVETFEVLVRADVKPRTIALAALIPLVPVAVVYALVFFKPSHLDFVKKIAFWTKKR